MRRSSGRIGTSSSTGATSSRLAERDLPCVATGDFHRLEHLNTWKTLLLCARAEDAVVSFLRSDARAYLMPFGLPERRAAQT
jgi:hypothetical protein